MFYVIVDDCTGISPVVPGLSIGFGGSRVFRVSSGVVASLLGLMARSIYGISSGGVNSMCGFISIPLSGWVFGGS